MASCRISKASREDLERIYRRSVRKYGELLADRYFDAFFEYFEDLAARPYVYPAVEEVRPGYWRSVCGVDNDYWRANAGIVEIKSFLGWQDIDHWL